MPWGILCINGGALGEDLGLSIIWLRHLGLGIAGDGHTAFVQWAFTGGLRDFYRDLRWEGWEAEVAGMGNDACMSFYPFLFTEQGSIHSSARRYRRQNTMHS
jgi:hypothetical protein